MKKNEQLTRIVFGGLARALITVNGRTSPHYTNCYQGSPSRHEPEVEMHNEDHLYENLDYLAPARPVTYLGTAPYQAASKDDAKADGKKRKETHGDRQIEVRRCTRAIRKERRNAERERQALLRQPPIAVAMETLELYKIIELDRMCRDELDRFEMEEMEMLEMDFFFYPDDLAAEDAADDLRDITIAGKLLVADALKIIANHTDPPSNIEGMLAARLFESQITAVAMMCASKLWINGEIGRYLSGRYDDLDDYSDYNYYPGPVYDDRDWDSVG